MSKQFKWYGKELLKKLELKIEQALEKGAILIENTAKASMTEPKTGKEVPAGQGSRGGHPWQKRQRSAPGEPPAVQTGDLRSSITHITPRPGVRHIGTNKKYGRAQELGYEPNNLAPRPFLRPAYKRNKNNLTKLFKNIL